MTEIWKPIPDFEGIYEASSLGRIRTCKGKVTYSVRHGVRHWKQRYVKYKVEKAEGYRKDYRVTLWKDKKPYSFLVSRLICSSFHGKPELPSLTVDHINGNYQDNCAENLEWVSRKENARRGWLNDSYSTAKEVAVTAKNTGYTTFYPSLSEASKAIGQCGGYLSEKLKRGRFENKNFSWQLV